MEQDTSSELKVVYHNSTTNILPLSSMTPSQTILNHVEAVRLEMLVILIVSTVSNKLKLPMHDNKIASTLMEDKS